MSEESELVALALEHGATDDEIREGIREKRLHAVAAERIIAGGHERLTLPEAIARSGIEHALGERVWRALGFVMPEADQLVCTDADVALFEFFVLGASLFSTESSVALARTTGSAMARLADSSIADARSMLEVPLRAEGGTYVDLAELFIDVATDVVPRMYPMFEAVHRRHLAQTARRYSLWGVAPSAESTSEAVVGFADVVGFTSLSQRLSAREIDALVVGFEEKALSVISRPGARLVKLIGDEVMFVAGDALDALDIARRLIDDPDLPDLRVGLAAGEIVSVEGDVYGPTVNLAARLVVSAEPGQVILDAATAARLGEGIALPVLPARRLPGYDEPVEVFTLERSEG